MNINNLKDMDTIGRGWSFPPQIDKQGRISMTSERTEIGQAITIILGTIIGERIMRPTFGSRLIELVFEPINSETIARAKQYVEEALTRWEPRINIREIEVYDPFYGTWGHAQQPSQLLIEIQYDIKSTREEDSLLYPLDLLLEKA